jgi:hypothetical protein
MSGHYTIDSVTLKPFYCGGIGTLVLLKQLASSTGMVSRYLVQA